MIFLAAVRLDLDSDTDCLSLVAFELAALPFGLAEVLVLVLFFAALVFDLSVAVLFLAVALDSLLSEAVFLLLVFLGIVLELDLLVVFLAALVEDLLSTLA